MTTCKSKLSMKLLIDTKADKILFAEADKNCVDFLFHILALQVSTVIRLLNKEGMTGSLPYLYNSLENMNDAYIIQSKDIILKPIKSSLGVSSDDLFLINDYVPTHHKTFYGCNNNVPDRNSQMDIYHEEIIEEEFDGYYHTSYKSCSRYVTDNPDAICPCCRKRMSRKLNYIASEGVKEAVATKGGFVKEAVTYMVMDDLVVMPMSAISSITLLNKFEVKDVGVLQEKVIYFGMEEVLKMLKASFESKTVLTSVFMTGAKRKRTE